MPDALGGGGGRAGGAAEFEECRGVTGGAEGQMSGGLGGRFEAGKAGAGRAGEEAVAAARRMFEGVKHDIAL